MEGATAKGYPEKVLEKIYSDWEEFAQYAFNKSHSTCYAVIAFQTAYLKTHYPAEFMAAVLKSNMGDIKKITFYMEEAQRMGIKVLGPDLNESRSVFTVTSSGEIRFGLSAVKGVGEGAVEEILQERDKNGEYASIFDLASRVNLRSVNKKNLESMTKAGVFDFDKRYHRAQYIQNDSDGRLGIELAIRYGQKIQADKLSGQTSLFGSAFDDSLQESEPKLPSMPEFSLLEELKLEEEVIGIFLSRHPLDDFKFVYNTLVTHSIKSLAEAQQGKDNQSFVCMGIITFAKEFISQKGTPYGRFNLMDYSGSHELALFRDNYLKNKALMAKDYILILGGTLEYNENKGEMRTNILSIQLASDLDADRLIKNMHVEMLPQDLINGRYQVLKDVLQAYPGPCNLWVKFYDPVENYEVSMVSAGGLRICDELLATLDEMEVKYNCQVDPRILKLSS